MFIKIKCITNKKDIDPKVKLKGFCVDNAIGYYQGEYDTKKYTYLVYNIYGTYVFLSTNFMSKPIKNDVAFYPKKEIIHEMYLIDSHTRELLYFINTFTDVYVPMKTFFENNEEYKKVFKRWIEGSNANSKFIRFSKKYFEVEDITLSKDEEDEYENLTFKDKYDIAYKTLKYHRNDIKNQELALAFFKATIY